MSPSSASCVTSTVPCVSQSRESTPNTQQHGLGLPSTSVLNFQNYLGGEMKDRWFGAMPVDLFLNEYLPSAKESLPHLPDNPFGNVPKLKKKNKLLLLDNFITVVKGWMPHLDAVNTSTRGDILNKPNIKTDISIYNRVEGVASPDRTDFTRMELWMAFNATKDDAPFLDPPNDSEDERRRFRRKGLFAPDTNGATTARGRLVQYAEAHHDQQVRHFSFSVVIQGDDARFLRWDPSATVVTASFNYRKSPRLMAEFLWRFDHLCLKQRGHDISIKDANLAPEADTRVRKNLRIKKDVPLYQYEVPGLIGTGHAYGPMLPNENRSLTRRCTRSSPMVWIPNEDATDSTRPCKMSWSKEKMIYLKDTWRCRRMAEHEYYEILHRHGTPNIPGPEQVAGGDVEGGGTEGEELEDAPWLCVRPTFSLYHHYRLVHGIVGRPVFKFKCTKELVIGILDALEAHAHAVKFAKILHRDISAGNIILTNEGRGLLIDWEMAKLMDENATQHPGRTGTWQFMSANLLQDETNLKVHSFLDDLESFLHVLAWITLRFVPAVDSYNDKRRKIDMLVFDEHFCDGDYESGGDRKFWLFAAGTYPSMTRAFEPRGKTPLFELIKKLRKPFRSLYGRPPTDESREKISATIDPSDWELVSLRYEIDAYDKDMKRLESSTWFIEEMKKALDQETWLTDDKCRNLPIRCSDETTIHEQNKTGQPPSQCSQSVCKEPKASPGNLKRAASAITEPSSKRRRVAT